MATLLSPLKLNISLFLTTPTKSSILPSLKWNPIHLQPHKFRAPKMVSGSEVWDRGSNFRPYNSSSPSSSFGNVDKKNGMIMVDTCLVVPPPNNRKPRAIIKFLGGAFIGKISQVTYSSLQCDIQSSQLIGLTVFSIGHSNGALLQVLTGSYFFEKIPKANAIVSFNNCSATEAVPYFEQVLVTSSNRNLEEHMEFPNVAK